MRTRWFSLLLGTALGAAIFWSSTPQASAQISIGTGRPGVNIGGGWGSPGWGGTGWGTPGWGGTGWGIGVSPGWGGTRWGTGWGGTGIYTYPSYSYTTPYYGAYQYTTPTYTYQPQTPQYQSFYHSPQTQYGQYQQGQAQQPTGPAVEVTMQDNQFNPNQLEVKVGQPVRWTNQGDAPHNVSQPKSGWGSQNLQRGQSFTHTFTRPGTYRLHCTIHPEMQMTVIVK